MKVLRCLIVIAVVVLLPFTMTNGLYAKSKGHGAHWSYKGKTGPSHWGDLAPEYAACKEGKSQSPIDITGDVEADLPKIEIDYKDTPLKIINNGHTIQINYESGSSITVGDKKYDLLQFHFHSPSEHKVNGKAYDMCIHLVHQAEDGQLGVIGLLLEKGKKNKLIKTLWKKLPKKEGKEKSVKKVSINAKDLLPDDLSYYNYSGSLTTPPCSEGVNWMVLKTPVEVSKKQIKKFKSIFEKSVRPVQPINERVIKSSK